MAVLLSEEKFGASAKTVNQLTEKLVSIDWYGNVGTQSDKAEHLLSQLLNTLDVTEYKIQWIDKKDLTETLGKISLAGSPLWEKLKDVPDQLKVKIDELAQEHLLEAVVDSVPETVFHPTFEAAFDKFGEEKVVQFLVGQAMYFALLICSAELANESELASQFIELLESGHIPIGPQGDIVYII